MIDDELDSGTVLKAFQKAIGHDVELDRFEGVHGGRTLFMNKTRQQIFSLLTRFPCAHLNDISRKLELTLPTTRWHLDKLVDGGFLSSKKVGNRIVFYPHSMIDADEVEILSFLSQPRAIVVFVGIRENPGLPQSKLARKLEMNIQTLSIYLKQLISFELVAVVVDGRFKRYYPTSRFKEMEDSHMLRLKRFREEILEGLTKDGVHPEVVRTTDKEMHVKILVGTTRSVFIIHTDPFITMLLG